MVDDILKSCYDAHDYEMAKSLYSYELLEVAEKRMLELCWIANLENNELEEIYILFDIIDDIKDILEEKTKIGANIILDGYNSRVGENSPIQLCPQYVLCEILSYVKPEFMKGHLLV